MNATAETRVLPPFPSPLSRRALRRMAPTMLVDGVIPFVLYVTLSARLSSVSVIPLAVAAFFPFLSNTVHLLRRRRLDTMGSLVLLSLAVSIAILVIGGDRRLLLVTRMLPTLAFGLAFLGSLLLPKPLAFYMLRQVGTGDDPVQIAAFDAIWRYLYVRHVYRVLTVVFGVWMLGEFAFRVAFVFTLTIAQVLAISPIVFNGGSMFLMLWMIGYGRHATRRVQAIMHQSQGESEEPLDRGVAAPALSAATDGLRRNIQ